MNFTWWVKAVRHAKGSHDWQICPYLGGKKKRKERKQNRKQRKCYNGRWCQNHPCLTHPRICNGSIISDFHKQFNRIAPYVQLCNNSTLVYRSHLQRECSMNCTEHWMVKTAVFLAVHVQLSMYNHYILKEDYNLCTAHFKRNWHYIISNVT